MIEDLADVAIEVLAEVASPDAPSGRHRRGWRWAWLAVLAIIAGVVIFLVWG